VADQSGSGGSADGRSPAGRIVREVSSLHASLLGKLRDELSGQPEQFAAAAQQLADDFGAVTATAVDAASGDGVSRPVAEQVKTAPVQPEPPCDEHRELASLYRPGHMRRRLDQMAETNKRYGHPFALAVFDASGPGTRNGDAGGGQETVLAVVGAALRDSIRIVDEAFRLEEDAICVLAPNLRTVEAVQMADRLQGQLDELEQVGGLRIAVSAGVVACPEHGADPDQLLHKADAAMWRARAVGQPVGVGALQDR
jgi:diguanylate cyclase (GGDEF)-like protein